MGLLDWIRRNRSNERKAEPQLIWTTDVYQNRHQRAWGWVQKTPEGKFNAGITVFSRDVGFEEWRTAEGCITKGGATKAATESLKVWRDAKAPNMKVASPRIQKNVKSMYGIAENANSQRERGRSQGQER
jgi:hypothetical protein